MSIEIDGKRYSWNQVICVSCWNQREQDDRQATPEVGSDRYVSGDVARCSYCGGGTTSGILVRDDPRTVRYPQLDTDGEIDASPAALGLSAALALELGLAHR